jgi:hypothetical protein
VSRRCPRQWNTSATACLDPAIRVGYRPAPSARCPPFPVEKTYPFDVAQTAMAIEGVAQTAKAIEGKVQPVSAVVHEVVPHRAGWLGQTLHHLAEIQQSVLPQPSHHQNCRLGDELQPLRLTTECHRELAQVLPCSPLVTDMWGSLVKGRRGRRPHVWFGRRSWWWARRWGGVVKVSLPDRNEALRPTSVADGLVVTINETSPGQPWPSDGGHPSRQAPRAPGSSPT